jgi:hypothetical protein
MENQVQESKVKVKKESSTVRVSNSTQKLLSSVLQKLNKKTYGRRVKVDPVLQLALSKLSEADLKMLQEQSLSNADRIEMKYREHCKRFGSVSKDEFLGLLMNGDAAKSTAENAAISERKVGA